MLDSVLLSGVVVEFNQTFVPLTGFVIGFVFGFVLQRTNFCPFLALAVKINVSYLAPTMCLSSLLPMNKIFERLLISLAQL